MMFTQRPHPDDPDKCFYDLQMFTLPNDTDNKRTADVAKRGGQDQSDGYHDQNINMKDGRAYPW